MGERIKRYREEAGLTPADLAKASNVNKSVVSRLESDDEYDPRLTTLMAICQALGISISKLLASKSTQAAKRRQALRLLKDALKTLE